MGIKIYFIIFLPESSVISNECSVSSVTSPSLMIYKFFTSSFYFKIISPFLFSFCEKLYIISFYVIEAQSFSSGIFFNKNSLF